MTEVKRTYYERGRCGLSGRVVGPCVILVTQPAKMKRTSDSPSQVTWLLGVAAPGDVIRLRSEGLFVIQCHVGPLNLIVVPDHEAVAGDDEAEADKSNRPRHKRPHDDDDG